MQLGRAFFEVLQVVRIIGRDRIGSTQPTAQIYVCAAARAKRAIGGDGFGLADRTAHFSTWLRGSRALLRCNS